MSTLLEYASQQGAQLANAGRPAPSPTKMPVPGDEVTEANIILIATKGQHGRTYLNRAARQQVFNQIPDKGTVVKQDMGDVQLCRAWIMGHSLDFIKRASNGRTYKPMHMVKRFK